MVSLNLHKPRRIEIETNQLLDQLKLEVNKIQNFQIKAEKLLEEIRERFYL